MKIALAAARQINRDIPYNLTQMEHFMREAKVCGADLVCFGETFLQGFDCFDWRYDKDCHMAVSIESDAFQRVCRISGNIGMDVLFGFVERDGETLYSSAALLADGKLHQLYRRISRGWKEYRRTDHHYQEGDTVSVFNYRGKKCVIGLCGDLWDYPDRFKLGEDILLWPVYISYSMDEWENGVKAEYAAQAKLCCGRTLLVNSICDGDAYGGAVFFEDGKAASWLPMGEEGLLIVRI